MIEIEALIEDFEFLTDWEDRYAHLMELGEALEPMPDALKVEQTKVRGCMSQVWMVARWQGDRLHIIGDSDARIVRGLIAVLLAAFQDKTPAEIEAVGIEDIFSRLGLDRHLSLNRRNGFAAMVQRIHALAQAGPTAG